LSWDRLKLNWDSQRSSSLNICKTLPGGTMIKLSSCMILVLTFILAGATGAEAVQHHARQGLQTEAAAAPLKVAKHKTRKNVIKVHRHKRHGVVASRRIDERGPIGWHHGYYVGDGPYPQWILSNGMLSGPMSNNANGG
jgi:hypothetical protein